MWRRPEGGLNAKVLSGYLNSIQFHLMRHPGVSLRALTHHYRSLFTPVDLRDLLEVGGVTLFLSCLTVVIAAVNVLVAK